MDGIRKAEERDLEAVNGLLRQVLAVHHRGRPDLFRESGKKYTDEELLAIFENPQTPVFVYERGGEVLGYVFCAVQHQGSGSLQELTTHILGIRQLLEIHLIVNHYELPATLSLRGG